MLANRVKKKHQHLRKRFSKQHIDVFRLYDWDIPEIRAVVDWYAGHIVIGEYARRQSTPEWLPMMGKAIAQNMGIPEKKIHLKIRRAGKQDGLRYERLDTTDETLVVSERDLKFIVNLNDYVDTGLFSDHRNTRQMIRKTVQGKTFLNLFCYTGSFSCYAAMGDAKLSVSVDRSETAIKWARKNFEMNGITDERHTLIQADTFKFLKKYNRDAPRFELAVVDPPSYSTTRNTKADFDIARDQLFLLKAITPLMCKKGTIYFSTNHQNFTPRMGELNLTKVEEITSSTIPEDYISKRKQIHRCWKLVV